MARSEKAGPTSVKSISSRHNPVVKRFRDASRDASDLILLDGLHLVQEAIAAGVRITALAVSAESLGESAVRAAIAMVEQSGDAAYTVPEPLLRAMTPVATPSGLVALAERPTSLLMEAINTPGVPLVVIALDVQDPGNVGAIVRSADAGGASAVVFAGGADPFGWKALRGSMGSVFHLPVAVATLPDVLFACRISGIRVAATVSRGGTSMYKADLRQPVALLLGTEGTGLPEPVVASADGSISVPMRSAIESLNVAVAAAILVYEAARQRKQA